MDDFTASAHQMRVGSLLLVGATFGIFLTIGNAWSAFLQAAVYQIMPNDDDDAVVQYDVNVMRELLYASLATFVCVVALLILVKIDHVLRGAPKALTRRNVRRIAGAMGVRIVEPHPIRPLPTTEETRHRQSRVRVRRPI